MEEIIDSFTQQTGIPCEIILGSSGKLTAQIQQGAPYDVFVSANMIYPNQLFSSGMTTSKPRVYAYGTLVLWTLKEDIEPSLEILKTDTIRNIATANPQIAPYGLAAQQCLQYYKLYDQVQGKLVFGESISQTNQFITSKTADIGFTAKSVVLSPKMKDQGTWIEIPSESYSLIEQGAAIITRNTPNPHAQKLYDFLFSNEVLRILEAYGYQIP